MKEQATAKPTVTHDEPEARGGESYLPDGMPEPGWYQPTPRGWKENRRKMVHLRELDRKRVRSNGFNPDHRALGGFGLGQWFLRLYLVVFLAGALAQLG